MKRISLVATTVLLLGSFSVVNAQTVHHSLHEMAPTIDGAKTPELIPDAVAYHLFFVQNADSMERQKLDYDVSIINIHLSADDRNILVSVIKNYKKSHEDAVKVLASGEDFRTRRDVNALGARSELQRRLSPQGYAKLDAYIQQEKSKMIVAAN